MPEISSELEAKLRAAVEAGELRSSSFENIVALLRGSTSAVYPASIGELAIAGEWNELNDRFFKTLAFGTGGLRGRTIGKIVTAAERGSASPNDRPEFPCVGTNAMNFYNISRATQGLAGYLQNWFASQKISGKPKIVIAFDTRHFSQDFADLAAKVATGNGCDAFVFESPRSTPELSFAVRQLKANAGIVITASHNPPHDNGYKVYFADGAQVIEPHASGIIAKVNAVAQENFQSRDSGTITKIGREIDDAYMRRLEGLILDLELVKAARDLKIVFTPIHGTGGVIIKPMLARFGFHFETVAAQDQFDGRFPTVKSPNPENADALKLAVEQAEKSNADLVVATDPDCDRMGVAVRTVVGKMKLLTGNQIGSLIAFYRAEKLFERGILTKANANSGVIIKTFVTTDLQKAIAEHYGLRCVETLTGFKYIGAKLGKYEREGGTLFIFGGEESYGYSGGDFVRDKDANGATIMFCEVAAYAKSRGLTIDALLDEVYETFGYFEEKNGALTFEGADGAATIQRLLVSYDEHPPTEMLGVRVASVKNFERETFRDVEGDEIPKEKMLIFELENRTRIAVRGSGTEPKIKFYLFAERRPVEKKFSAPELADIKLEVEEHLTKLWDWLQRDAHTRSAA